MFKLYKLNIIYLILYLRFSELNSKSIDGHQQDNNGIYDKGNDNITGIYENEIYNTTSSRRLYYTEPLLSTDIPLEQSIMPAQLILTTSPYSSKATNNSIYNYLTGQFVLDEDSEDYLTDQSYEYEDLLLNNDELESLLVKFENSDENLCFLDNLKKALFWWTYANGTLKEDKLNDIKKIKFLDLSYQSISQDDVLYEELQGKNITELQVFSLAYNNFTKVPQQTLLSLSESLKYLTLAGNQFAPPTQIDTHLNTDILNVVNGRSNSDSLNVQSGPSHCSSNDANPPYADNLDDEKKEDKKMFYNREQHGTEWATFPYLPKLKELDISNCQIEYITKRVFRNVSQLERLIMSYNNILTIPYDSFYYIRSLEFLDLSFLNILETEDMVTLPDSDAILNLFFGLNIQQPALKYLTKLQYLDFSHTTLTKSSAVAFAHLSASVEYLSLCYTQFPMLDKAIFKQAGIKGLDVSGNLIAGHNIPDDAFEGIVDSLKYLYFERSNVRDLSWLRKLWNLRFLGLNDNNINSLNRDVFIGLRKLQLLDLSSNQVGNWYNRVFSFNENLRVLSLSNNNLNIITSEMMKDFELLEYLSLGDNDFVCDCLLRQLVNVAKENNRNEKCRRRSLKEYQEVFTDIQDHEYNKTQFKHHIRHINTYSILWKQHLKRLESGYRNLRQNNETRYQVKMRFKDNNNLKSCNISSRASDVMLEEQNGTVLKFQLLDYQDEHYYCFNETEKTKFVELNCQQKSFVQDLTEKLNTLTFLILVCLGSILAVSFIGFLIYWKRWYIHYYYSSFKTASLMSAAARDNNNKFQSLFDQDPNMIYDVFISYCQNDRDWILEHLMPNVEETGDISICLHERDFQIGVTILDNIVTCMDRSRALMLIISSDFLLSHWCQFEMHLAQHRIFDVRQDHLILIFLEDIPRSKRPKHLQYLMDVKTYIKWPGGKDTKGIRLEERKLFWKRLKRSLANIGLNPVESKV